MSFQAELDALRAKRAMEQSERLAREKERREAEFKVLYFLILYYLLIIKKC